MAQEIRESNSSICAAVIPFGIFRVNMLTALVQVQHPSATEVRAYPGDWGIDTFAGSLVDKINIWQSKYFSVNVDTTFRIVVISDMEGSSRKLGSAAKKRKLTA